MAPHQIKELIKNPFGPYPDSVILNPAFPRHGSRNLPQLTDLRLLQDNQPIGFDQCERYVVPPTTASTVFFIGVLLIEELSWLSADGKVFLQEDLDKRDGNATKTRRLTLEALYGQKPASGLKISVWVHCEREMRAMYMTNDEHPQSLILNSTDRHRSYEIRTLHRDLYGRSRNFLQRYRLVALINELQQEYELPANSIEIEELITGYLKKHEKDGVFELLKVEGDTTTIHRPRHVSRAEVREIFATHSGWLLAHYLRMRRSRCLINIRSWCDFIGRVRVGKKAKREWAKTYEDDEIWDSDIGGSPDSIAKTLARFGGTAADWETRLVNAITKPPPENIPTYDYDEEIPLARSKPRGFAYDSDFSEASTPGCSDSEYDSEPPAFSQTNVPPLLRFIREPRLRPGRFIWDCNIPGCSFSIDFLNFNKPEFDGLEAHIIAKKQFDNLSEEHVQALFHQSVSAHYEEHLENSQIQWDRQKYHKRLQKKWSQKQV